jgi:membrane dipeptidase
VDHGLTPLGRDIVKASQRLGMVLDIASVSKRGFRDLLELAEGPVIASHTNASELCAHEGNLDDDELKAIAETGGLVAPIANGMTVSSKPRVTLSDFVDHIDHMAQCMGIDHVALGPDIVEDSHYPLEAYRRLFADEGYWSTHYPEGFSTHRELPNVTAELLRRGYSETDVRKVLGENLLRVYSTVWHA